MTKNNNGFADGLERINKLLSVGDKVAVPALVNAAETFAEGVRSRINSSDINKQTHLKNELKVDVQGDKVVVYFTEEAWYWYLVEHGHLVAEPHKRLKRKRNKQRTRIKRGGKGTQRVKGQHFVQNTVDADLEEIKRIMVENVLGKMKG